MIISGKRRTKKPNVGARLNYADPRTRRLRYAFPFNEGGGGYAAGISLKNHALPLTATTQPTDGLIGSTTSVTWHPKGCLNYASSTTSYVDAGANDDTTGEITWIAWVLPRSLAALSTIFGQNTSGGNESLDSVYFATNGRVSWFINHSGGLLEVLNGTIGSIVVDTPYRLAGRRAGSTGAWTYHQWINEKLDDTATGVTQNPAVRASDGNFRVGFAGLFTSAPFVGDYTLFLFWNGVALKDDQLLDLSANPWQLWEKPRGRFAIKTVSASVTVTPGTAALTTARFAPTVLTPRLVTPGTKALTTARFAPTVTIDNRVVPGTKALTTARFSPTVLTPRLVTPGTKALTLTTFAPTVTATSSLILTPGKASLTLTTFAPTVTVPVQGAGGGADGLSDLAPLPIIQPKKEEKEETPFYRHFAAGGLGYWFVGTSTLRFRTIKARPPAPVPRAPAFPSMESVQTLSTRPARVVDRDEPWLLAMLTGADEEAFR